MFVTLLLKIRDNYHNVIATIVFVMTNLFWLLVDLLLIILFSKSYIGWQSNMNALGFTIVHFELPKRKNGDL